MEVEQIAGRFRPKGKDRGPQVRTNKMIKAAEVRLLGDGGEQLGIMSSDDACALAEDKGLDLVEVSPNAKPPVCRIMDYGKYKYLMSKKAHEAKKKQTVIHVKEVKFRVKTEEHDFLFKLKNIFRFLGNGDKVKVVIFFRGREITHKELGMNKLKRVIEETKDVAVVEAMPRMEGRTMILMLGPVVAKTARG